MVPQINSVDTYRVHVYHCGTFTGEQICLLMPTF